MFKGKLLTIVLNWKKLMLKDENLHQIFTLTKGSAIIKLKFSFLISGGWGRGGLIQISSRYMYGLGKQMFSNIRYSNIQINSDFLML